MTLKHFTGLEVGGYDLISWTRVVDSKWMALNASGSVSDSACFASGWYDSLLGKVYVKNIFCNHFTLTLLPIFRFFLYLTMQILL